MKAVQKSSLLILLASLLTTACVRQTVYHSYHSIPSKGWSKYDTLAFEISITDSIPSSVQLRAEIRNDNNYPYQNLFVVVSHNLQDSITFKTDTLTFMLADNEGNWERSAWGVLRQSSILLEKLPNPGAGVYTVKMSHGMKDAVLLGVHDIGVKLSAK